MEDQARRKQYAIYLKGELEAAALYHALAGVDPNPEREAVFRRLAEAEMRHAARWAEKLGRDVTTLEPARLGLRPRLLRWTAKRFGTRRVVPLLLWGEARDVENYAVDREARDLSKEERGHGRTLRALAGTQSPLEVIRAESRAISGGSGILRAAVLGINDGLVSNLSLVMGVAGGTSDPQLVLLAGVAGLLAGAFSMAAGEYVSMRSQRDVYEHQIRIEKIELERWPEEEEEELVLIYQAKGLSETEAQVIAKRLMADPEMAIDTMAREELGLDPSQLGSPWGASISSFVAFVVGALVPILPYIFSGVGPVLFLSASLSAVALIGVGGALAALSGVNVFWGATRMVLAGGAAAAVTYGVGSAIGASLSL